ncbi:MAG: hypothetical protein P4L53_05770 [Candidatus Obscuribacterales bacterium]|nr:hypothetical protein [Candidatus Obscuribacterales bacterium]
MGAGIAVGLIVALVVGAITGQVVLQTPQSGVMEGLLAGICAGWPFFHTGSVHRYNFLHPVPRRYNVPLKNTFGKLRRLISEKSYNYGDKWHVSASDTLERRISAQLRFTEEESRGFHGSNISNIQHKTQRVQRLLELDIQLKESTDDSCIVQFDFKPKTEGLAWYACDSIISGLLADTEALLGPGTDDGNPADTSLPAPPWWVIGIGALGLLTLCADVRTAVFK